VKLNAQHVQRKRKERHRSPDPRRGELARRQASQSGMESSPISSS
jgi:hypothetical protein